MSSQAAPPDYPRLRDLGGGVLQIDTMHHGNPGTIAVFVLLLPEGGYALVETGPGVSRPAVEAGLVAAGLPMADLRFVLLTHIHLDHAGGAGALIEAGAAQPTLIVHQVGAPHMIDPSRLMASAERIYGDELAWLWGAMKPVASERVRAVAGGEKVAVGGLEVEVLYTPGHASHHVAYLLPDGSLFTGDAAAVKLAGADLIRPAVPPPDLDLESWEQSIELMRAVKPSRLILTHFGPVAEADQHLAAIPARHRSWEAEVIAGLKAGEGPEALTARMQRLEDLELRLAGVAPGIASRYRVTSDAAMTVTGLTRYLTKHHPERLV